MAGNVVSELFSVLGLKVDESQWKRGDQAIAGMKTAILGLATYFGGQVLGKALIGFNASVEDTKLQIAGMLALTKKTDLTDQLSVADDLYANLQRRAASLPGTTAEYTQMLGALTQTITDAGLGLQDLEDITVNATVGAKAFGIAWDVAARDIDQALRGQFHSTDAFTGKILGTMGFKGEEGRKKFNAMNAKQRAETLKQALTQKQLTQLAEAQGNSFGGVMSTVQDAIQQFFGRVGAPLFKAIKEELKGWTVWLEKNKEKVDEFAATLGTVMIGAFHLLKAAVLGVIEVMAFFARHGELMKALMITLGLIIAAFAIKAAIAWAVAFFPIIAAIAVMTAITLVVMDLWRSISTGKGIAASAFRRVRDEASNMWANIKNLPHLILTAFQNAGAAIRDAFGQAFDWIINRAKEVAGEVWSTIKDIPVIGTIAEGIEAVAAPSSGILGGMDAFRRAQTVPGSDATAGASVSIGGVEIVVNPSAGMDEAAIGEIAARKAAEQQQLMIDDAWDVIKGGRR